MPHVFESCAIGGEKWSICQRSTVLFPSIPVFDESIFGLFPNITLTTPCICRYLNLFPFGKQNFIDLRFFCHSDGQYKKPIVEIVYLITIIMCLRICTTESSITKKVLDLARQTKGALDSRKGIYFKQFSILI